MPELISESAFVNGLNLAVVVLFTAGVVALLVGLKNKRPRARTAGVALMIAAPHLWVMWRIYNKVTQHFGLDSVQGLGVNLIIFVVAGVFFGSLMRAVRRLRAKGDSTAE